ncbi:MAG: type II toxin-antitoxin system RelE/ParE family toxin [Actinobacillus porcinus]|uniref:type II toxin-antitoxin system RelE/ParE family toxin n=1 Tax=Actinobacillus porcinus TaxID=51048 RepID=UPI002356EB9D|nr:type II toxin-antitoxin system RelE/ParE family toxin [Actinobacillus porcinus]MCI5763463.1 type II toxin-antitoxin system RelE/ParE family toxin [Actinobacillus porcinus]
MKNWSTNFIPKPVELSLRAQNNINAILDSVYQYTSFVSTPQKLMQEFTVAFERIGLLPKGGRLQDDGTRMTFCRHYRIIYKEFDDKIVIVTVVHSKRRYPQPE